MRTNQDRGEALRPAPRRRRQPDFRSERSVARSLFRTVRAAGRGLVRRRVGDLLAEQPARGAREPGGQRQPDGDDRPRARADDGPRRPGGVRRSSSRRGTPLRFGADVNFERLTSDAFNVNPVSGAITPRRPRVPDNARLHPGRRVRADHVRRPCPIACGSSARCATAARGIRAEGRGQPGRERPAALAGRLADDIERDVPGERRGDAVRRRGRCWCR